MIGTISKPGLSLVGVLGLALVGGACGSRSTARPPEDGGASGGGDAGGLPDANGVGGFDGGAGFLTSGEVTGLPPGNAQGAGRSGLYIIRETGAPTCSCRLGNCDDLVFSKWWIISVAESEGVVDIVRARGNGRALPCTGGVDDNGDYRCGAARTDSLFLLQGHLSTENGIPVAMSMTDREVIREVDGAGHSFDCDAQGEFTFEFLGR
jgi:hypothetical protein